MDEQNTTQEEEQKSATEAEDAGSKYETTPVIERARQERERMEQVTKELREENDRRERIMAKQALGGVTEARQQQKPKEETDAEYRARIEREVAEGKYND